MEHLLLLIFYTIFERYRGILRIFHFLWLKCGVHTSVSTLADACLEKRWEKGMRRALSSSSRAFSGALWAQPSPHCCFPSPSLSDRLLTQGHGAGKSEAARLLLQPLVLLHPQASEVPSLSTKALYGMKEEAPLCTNSRTLCVMLLLTSILPPLPSFPQLPIIIWLPPKPAALPEPQVLCMYWFLFNILLFLSIWYLQVPTLFCPPFVLLSFV